MNGIKEMWEKVLGIGKDRYLILLGIGLMCVVIAGMLDRQDARKQEDAAGQAQVAEKQTEGSQEKLWELSAGQQNEAEGGIEQIGIDKYSMIRYEEYYRSQLESLLAKMEGVGSVRVFVSLRASEEIVLEKSSPYSRRTEEQSGENGQSKVTDTQSDSQVVFYENENGRNTPVIVKRYAPKVEGIVVLAQGASNPKVSANITQFLMALFELPEHKIKVANYHT